MPLLCVRSGASTSYHDSQQHMMFCNKAKNFDCAIVLGKIILIDSKE